MRNAKIKLGDLGFDASNIPDEYTPTGANYTFTVDPSGFKEMENNKSTKFKYLFNVLDQNHNLVKNYIDYSNDDDESSDKSWAWISRDGFKLNPLMYMNGDEIPDLPIPTKGDDNDDDDDDGDDDGQNQQYSQDYQVTSANVTVPTHTLKINYVDQNNSIVFSTQRQVTSYGHTSFYTDEAMLNKNGITINDGQTFIPNTDTTANVMVTSSGRSGYNGSYDYGYPEADDVPGGPLNSNPDSTTYHTEIDLIGRDGKFVLSMIAGSSLSNMVDVTHFYDDAISPKKYPNFKVTGLPNVIDLTKGPYTAYGNITFDEFYAGEESSSNETQTNSSQAPASQQPTKSSSQPAPVVQSHLAATPVSTAKAATAPVSTAKAAPEPAPKPAPKPVAKPAPQTAKPAAKAKPSKTQFKAIAKSYKQRKHAVKADAAKLKAIKKKMKKHATKKQKAAYKNLQTKLAADKKAVKSYKAQEGKLTKYFKEVAVINRDNKQIKSLTAQMKKLKKKHSKTSKKQYSRDAKALKKANNSLKAATKFVNNYK
ncbi:hypothetical protein [Apilactobacillus kunkeei]|nr:hypothetical protein [Apilactobacillus kunkeei]